MSTILKRTKAAAAKTAKKMSKPETDPDTTEPDDAATDPDDPTAAATETEADTEAADTEDAADVEDEDDELAEEDDEDDDGEGDEEFEFEDDGLDDDTPAPRRRVRSARQVLVVLALVALVLSGAVFYLLTQVNDARAAGEAGDEAVSAARAHAQDLLSYDYRTLDSDFARGLAATTGGFHSQYQQTTTQLVRPQAAQQKIIVQAAVMNAGLVSANSDNAVVLLFVDRVTTKSGQQKPAFDQDRVRMSMTKVNGKWLVAKLDAL
jgi:Mce-associated membrane protein